MKIYREKLKLQITKYNINLKPICPYLIPADSCLFQLSFILLSCLFSLGKSFGNLGSFSAN